MSRLIASFFGVGFFPVAPGTAGSVVALLIGSALMLWAPWALLVSAAAAAVLGFFAVRRAVVDPEADPGWVVIDEVAGQWIAMLGLAGVSASGLIAAFVGFRVLDIWKPGPIGWADRQSGAYGIMADDVLAGVVVAVMLYVTRFAMALWWGEQIR